MAPVFSQHFLLLTTLRLENPLVLVEKRVFGGGGSGGKGLEKGIIWTVL